MSFADATVDEQLVPSKSVIIDPLFWVKPIKYEIKFYFQTCNSMKYNHLNGMYITKHLLHCWNGASDLACVCLSIHFLLFSGLLKIYSETLTCRRTMKKPFSSIENEKQGHRSLSYWSVSLLSIHCNNDWTHIIKYCQWVSMKSSLWKDNLLIYPFLTWFMLLVLETLYRQYFNLYDSFAPKKCLFLFISKPVVLDKIY